MLPLRTVSRIAVLLVPFALVTACGSDSKTTPAAATAPRTVPVSATTVGVSAASGSVASGSAAAATSAVAAPTTASTLTSAAGLKPATSYHAVTIKFADPGNQGIMAYGKKNNSFDSALAAVNAKIEWVPAAAAFSANFDLLKAGKINTHQAAVSPILGAVSRGLDFRIFSISDPAPAQTDGIIATKASGITTVADLKGKKAAVNAKAHGEWLLLEALVENGVDPSTVTRVPIQPADAAAAFASGQVDAWATFGSFYASAVAGGGVPIYRGAAYKNYDDVGVVGASSDVLQANPAAFEAFEQIYEQLSAQAMTDPEQFVNVFDSTGPQAYSGAVKDSAIADLRNSPIPHLPGPADAARITRVVQLFVDNGVLDKSFNVASVLFDPSPAQGG